MSSITHLLTETATHIKVRPSESVDSLGNPIMSSSSSSISASHVQGVAGTIGANGAYYTAKIYLQASEDVQEDDIIQTRGKEYWVNSVTLHHAPIDNMEYISCELRETPERRRLAA